MKGDVISLGSVSPRDWETIEKHYFCIEWYVFMPRERLSNQIQETGDLVKNTICVSNCMFSALGVLIQENGNLIQNVFFA